MNDIERVQDSHFDEEVEKLVKHAETSRLKYSQSFDSRRRASFGLSLLVITAASSWFLWLLLMGGADIRWAWVSLAAVVFVPVLLHTWTKQPVAAYTATFKSDLMPRMAKLLGQLRYSAKGGISMKAIGASRVIPPHSIYKAEDAFMGIYKKTKILISEARLLKDKRSAPVFKGVFVLLLTPPNKFKGHTIITSDEMMIKRYRTSRWQKLSEVSLAAGSFKVFSDNPEEGARLADEDMMALMSQLGELFTESKITAVFFRGNRVFLMIPNEADMFEPGDIYMPITNKTHALKCKREIEQILTVVDILDVYEADSSAPGPAPDPAPPATGQ